MIKKTVNVTIDINEYYLDLLIDLLTEKQKNLLDRIFPNGILKKDRERAIDIIKRTICDLNDKTEENTDLIKEMKLLKEEHQKEVNSLERKIKRLNADLKMANDRIDKLNNPIDIENADVQESLELLNALESAGVDNWGGWDFAMDILNGREYE